MPRLFVAIDLPAQTREALGAIINVRHPALRVLSPEEIHLTLHFIGEGEVEAHATALSRVNVPSFDLKLEKLGAFRQGKGNRIIWMGVQPSDGLLHVHREVGETLATVGYIPERRPYSPHITLARAKPEFPKKDLERILAECPGTWPPLPIRNFTLYSSQLTSRGARHTAERTYPLKGGPASPVP